MAFQTLGILILGWTAKVQAAHIKCLLTTLASPVLSLFSAHCSAPHSLPSPHRMLGHLSGTQAGPLGSSTSPSLHGGWQGHLVDKLFMGTWIPSPPAFSSRVLV